MSAWRKHLIALGLTIATLIAIFWRDAFKMAEIWWTSSTFTHCLFIMPLVGWLIWQRKDEVANLTPRAWMPGLFFVGAGAFAWMIGQAAGVNFIRQVGLIFMIQSSVLTLLGLQVTRGLLFPIFYLSFLVPFGEELVPILQTITAKLCMIFLGWAGVPAHIEGVFINTPTGRFEVAEACSGVKFLVAMLAYSALAANVCFKSWKRRVLFMIVSVIVPIIANGIRAYGTIHIAYRTSMDFAGSFDHVIYGWFFFGFVMLLVMGASWKFFDRKVGDPWLDDRLKAQPVLPQPASWRAPVAVLVVALLPWVWQAALANWGRGEMPHKITLPEVAGWKRVPQSQSFPWTPRFDGADHRLLGEYENAQNQRVDLAIVLYASQDEGREIVGYAQGAFDPGAAWSWANDTAAPTGGKSERIFAGAVSREVASFYRMGGVTTGNENRVKMETLKTRLLGGDQAAAAVLVSAEDRPDAPSRGAIDAFLRALGPVDAVAARAVAEARGH